MTSSIIMIKMGDDLWNKTAILAARISEMTLSHYDEVLQEARQKGELIANKYTFELYTILRDEERLPPEDCRAKIEQDCVDLWSKATIRKHLPEEAKIQRNQKQES
jgi:hypothetical protein